MAPTIGILYIVAVLAVTSIIGLVELAPAPHCRPPSAARDYTGEDNDMSKQFHLGDVLSVTHDRLVSPRHIDGVYDILNYMTGDDLYTHALPRAADTCRPELLRQHPKLASAEVNFQVAKLGEMLKSESGKANPEELVAGWLFQMTLDYGETLSVEPLRPADYEYIDPVQELEDKVGKGKVIVI
jgi:hypothetical protein